MLILRKTDTTEEITPLVFNASSDMGDFQLPSESKVKIKGVIPFTPSSLT